MGIGIFIGWVYLSSAALAVIGFGSRFFHKERLLPTNICILGSIVSAITVASVMLYVGYPEVVKRDFALLLVRVAGVMHVIFVLGVAIFSLIEWFKSRRRKFGNDDTGV